MHNFSVSEVLEFGAQAWGGSLGKPLCAECSHAACRSRQVSLIGSRQVNLSNIRALIIRIGFWGRIYYT